MDASSTTITPANAEAGRLLRLATHLSVSVALILIVAKAYAWWMTDSVAILASLVDSLMDAGASLLNLFAVRYALAPADASHRWGHGKAEAIAGLGQGVFILGSGIFLVSEAVNRLMNPAPVTAFSVGIGVMVLTIVLTAALVAVQSSVIRRTRSAAIRADSLHYRADLLTNAAVLAALVLAHFGWPGVDPLFALAVAAYTLKAAWDIIRDALSELLDQELPEARRQEIIAVASGHPQVRGVHDLRTRSAGRVDFIELHLELDDHMPLMVAHEVSDAVEEALVERIPHADVMIHLDPVSLSEELLDDKIEAVENAGLQS
ncbi:MAG: cation diffusion facilitator family transporter [Luminiphilus sp.]|jgi:ferrous-iron efflux pump FieF